MNDLRLTDVQKQAIKIIMDLTGSTIHGLSFGAGVREVNDLDELTYNEAIGVIKYGNDLVSD